MVATLTAVESPAFVQNVTKPFNELAKSGTQSIPNATPTVWQIDSSSAGFSWVSAINGSFQIPIPETGVYTITANMNFTASLAGQTFVEILKGSSTLAANGLTSTSVATVSTTKYLTAGDLISVRVTQNSGGAATLNGSAAGLSYLNIQKLFDV